MSRSPASTASTEAIAAAIITVAGLALGFLATIHGGVFVQQQLANPVFPTWWGLVVTLLAIAGIILGTMIVAASFIELVAQIFNPPVSFAYREYPLIGIGGALGTAAGLAVALGAHIGVLPALAVAVAHPEIPDALVGATVVGMPLAGLFRVLSDIDERPLVSDTAGEVPPPEVRQARRKRLSQQAGPPSTPQQPTTESTTAGTKSQEGSTTQDEQENDASHPADDEDDTEPLDEPEFNWRSETDVSMDEVGGMEDLKRELQTDVITPLTTGREKAEAFDIPVPNIIFHGPPGTGKTYMAKALATELGFPFAQLSGADVQSKWINESASTINTLFEEAKQMAQREGGAVVFIDELDSVLKSRSGEGGRSHEEDKKVVNEFLNHLQDTDEHNIVFIGATNRFDALDDAGVRSGRIDKKIYVGKPDVEARAKIMRAQLLDRPYNLDAQDVMDVAAMAEGAVAADLEMIVVEAAREAAFERDGEAITRTDLEKGLQDSSVA